MDLNSAEAGPVARAGRAARRAYPCWFGVIGVIRVLPVNGPSSGMNNRNNMFDLIYQFRLNDMYNLLSADMVYYTQVQQHLSMLDMLLVGDRSF